MKIYSFYNDSHIKLKDIFCSSLKNRFEIILSRIPETTEISNKIAGGFNVWVYKTRAVISAISENLDRNIIFSDIDIKFFKKIDKMIISCLEGNDILFQDDRFGGKAVNIGFMVIRCNQKTLDFFKEVLDIVENKKNLGSGSCVEAHSGLSSKRAWRRFCDKKRDGLGAFASDLLAVAYGRV